jgi:hypothetical protein
VLASLVSASDRPEIRLEHGRFVVTGWSEAARTTPEYWKEKFAVFVGTANSSPMLGAFQLEGDDLSFQPRFPLQEGLRYRAVLKTDPPVESLFDIPRVERQAARVQAVFPSSNRLPENLLKFYVHFSAPMSRGEIYSHISLIDGTGSRVELPFLELEQELWDRTGSRLTVLFDPGRIKRGLVPHNDVGPALEAGRSYTFVIAATWRDAAGTPLARKFRKNFEVITADREPPDPSQWRIFPPPAAGRGALEVRFPEPMDHALIEHMLLPRTPGGEEVKGEVLIEKDETVWRFVPGRAWAPGIYRLAVDTALEDLAGNRIGRPFDVDLFEPIQRRITREELSLPFEIR